MNAVKLFSGVFLLMIGWVACQSPVKDKSIVVSAGVPVDACPVENSWTQKSQPESDCWYP